MAETDRLIEYKDYGKKKQGCCSPSWSCCFWHTDNVRDGWGMFATSGATYFLLDVVIDLEVLPKWAKVTMALAVGAVSTAYTVGRNIGTKKYSNVDVLELENRITSLEELLQSQHDSNGELQATDPLTIQQLK